MNAVVREYLASYAGEHAQAASRRRLLELSDRADAGSGPGGRSWTREDLYAERATSARA